MHQASEEEDKIKKLTSGSSQEFPVMAPEATPPHPPRIVVTLSACRQKGQIANHSTPKVSLSALAGVDTYTSHSVISLFLIKKLNVSEQLKPPNIGSEVIGFLDGNTTKVLGTINLIVRYIDHQTVVSFVVVNTVKSLIGAELLLGIDYICKHKTLKLSFPKNGDPIITQFISAAALPVSESADGGDFTLTRRPDKVWSLKWLWKSELPLYVYKGVDIYHSRLKAIPLLVEFKNEVSKWIKSGFVVPYNQSVHGSPRCILTWNPVVQLHKSTKVRPTLDYLVLNPFIESRDYVTQSEVCHESLRKWRKFCVARLVDVEKAYMNIFIDDDLLPIQVVRYENKLWSMNRMGFGLNIAPRVPKVLSDYIFKKNFLTERAVFDRDDILIGSNTSTPNSVAELEITANNIRKVLSDNGLPTKEAVKLFDFSSGPTRA